ncbi:MAG: hypothetical protein HFI63_07495 [Lachnospiraceae bacterium]|nr:hypothetical protein [Lachnospiraceae bacterium]
MGKKWETVPFEEKWIEEAKKTAGLVEPPESLSPQAVTERLKREGRKPKENPTLYKHLAQAAVLFLFLLLGGGSLWLFRQFGGESGKRSFQKSEIEDAEDLMQMKEGQSLPGSYQAAASYEEIYNYLEEQREASFSSGAEGGWEAATEAGMEGDGATPSDSENVQYSEIAKEDSVENTGKSAEASSDYSETNTQVKGIDEADIVKTDGNYLYVVYSGTDFTGRVHIIEVDGGAMREVSKTEPVTDGIYRDYDSVLELYLDGDTMTVLMDCIDDDSANSYTVTAVYDISDREKPKLISTLSQDGRYESSRKNGSYVYVFTSEYARAEDNTRSYIPCVEGELLSHENIYYSPEAETERMMIVTAIDTKSPDQFTDKKAVYCSGNMMYVSGNAIYAAETVYGHGNNTQTEIFKLSYKEGKLQAEGSKRFLGWLNNQFSMDEYNGYLRLVATIDDYRNGSRVNSLYVLNQDLEIVGSIHNLAPDERIYSARFMGDTGYFVTFRETDPLFSVDLSDPENPKIMGELKITGFSSYLHGYSEDLLLGIGEEINPRTGANEGLKLSMFDISDPYNVTEEGKEVLSDYQHSAALSNHKAVLIDTDKNLFGFLAYGYRFKEEEYCDYVLYSYDPEWGFTKRTSIRFSWDEFSGGYGSEGRGVYVGDTLYLIGFQDGVRAYSMKSGEEIGRLKLN